MSKIGFIGYGSMGSMLLNGFLESGRLTPEEIIVATRTSSKLEEVERKYPKLRIAGNNREVARAAGPVFLCVKPVDYPLVLNEIQDEVSETTHLVAITGPVKLAQITAMIPHAKVSKVIPSITSVARGGVALVCHHAQVGPEQAALLESLMAGISTVKVLPENDFDLAIEFTSCGPGYLAAIFQEFLQAGLKFNHSLSEGDAAELVRQTMLGTAKLLVENQMSFADTISRVAVKGGITAMGVQVIQAGLPQVFQELFRATLAKRELINQQVAAEFQK